MNLVLEKMFGKSRVHYIVGSLYQGQTVSFSFTPERCSQLVKLIGINPLSIPEIP